MNTDMDYAELWLDAQKAHKAIFEAALAKDWTAAMVASANLCTLSMKLETWFEDAAK